MIFPNSGLFTEGKLSGDQIEKIWVSQKLDEEAREKAKPLGCYGAHDNLLDYKGTWTK